MPQFMDGVVEPLLNIFSYIGIPVRKRQYNEFGERIYLDEFEMPAKVYQIQVPRAKFILNPAFQSKSKFVPYIEEHQVKIIGDAPVSNFNCGPEIPILLINKFNQSYIWHSPNQNGVIPFHSYRKLSDMSLQMGDTTATLDDFLKELTNTAEAVPSVKIERPKGRLVQGGGGSAANKQNEKPTFENIDEKGSEICTQCTDDVKKRPAFPTMSIDKIFVNK